MCSILLLQTAVISQCAEQQLSDTEAQQSEFQDVTHVSDDVNRATNLCTQKNFTKITRDGVAQRILCAGYSSA